jgi:hypothetical protein
VSSMVKEFLLSGGARPNGGCKADFRLAPRTPAAASVTRLPHEILDGVGKIPGGRARTAAIGGTCLGPGGPDSGDRCQRLGTVRDLALPVDLERPLDGFCGVVS